MFNLFPEMALGHLKMKSQLEAQDITKGDYKRSQTHGEERESVQPPRAGTGPELVGSWGKGETQ